MHAQQLIGAHPHVRGAVNAPLARCIDECYDCAQSCVICADACLGEEMVQQLLQCIRLNQDCADICAVAGAVASRRTGSNEAVIRLTLQACAEACRVCAEECERHADMHEHCRMCAESCRRCEEACNAAVQTVQ